MNITSYNISEVSYHYIGIRVLGSVSPNDRAVQLNTISTNVHKFVNDRALRLMLPAPRGRFETIGERICQELVHMNLAEAQGGYVLTDLGQNVLTLLDEQRYIELRRAMIAAHLQTYDNLRAIMLAHIAVPFWQPVVVASYLDRPDYLPKFLAQSFGPKAQTVLNETLDIKDLPTPAKIQDALWSKILSNQLPDQKIRPALFRAICDRLISLRLLNKSRVFQDECEFEKTYSPCVVENPPNPWYSLLSVLNQDDAFDLHLCEPDAADTAFQAALLASIDDAFALLIPEGGYWDIPDLRDEVCSALQIPERAFDDGLNALLDAESSPLSVGLQYEQITARRRPLVRYSPTTQLHNLIRRVS